MVQNGHILFGDTGDRLVDKAWKIGWSEGAWVSEVLYSLGKEGVCINYQYAVDLLPVALGNDTIITINRYRVDKHVSVHFPGLLAIIAPRSVKNVYQMIDRRPSL